MSRQLSETDIIAIRETGRAFSDATLFMHQAIAFKAGLSGTDHKYLGLIIKNGAMTAGDLAKLTGLTTGAITGLVDRLEKRQLVKREFDKADRRKVMIVPDQHKVDQLLGPLFTDLQSKITGLIAQQSPADMEIIKNYMLAAINIMNEVTNSLKEQ